MMYKRRAGRLLAAMMGVFFTCGTSIVASDWAQYRGPDGAGVSPETVSLPAVTAKPAWSVPASAGFSSFVVADDKAFTLVTRNVEGAPRVMCLALDARSGKELWAVPTGVAMFPSGGDAGAEDNKGGDGPRSTPAVSRERVYVYSAEMVLYCLNAKSGETVWKHDITKEFNGRNINWKSAMSPIVEGKLVYVAGGGAGESMLAFDKLSGTLAWKTGEEAMTHATPTLATIHGVRQIVFMMQSGPVALEAATGRLLWKAAFPYKTATGCSPVIAGDIVFCTAGYGIGAAAFRIAKTADSFSAKETWRVPGNNPLGSLWSTPVCKDGNLYGIFSYKEFSTGSLRCVDLQTGAVKWQQGGFGSGNVLLAGNQLVCLTDEGKVVLTEASPERYKELARFQAVHGKCWSSPALSDGKLYVRSTKEGACFSL